MTDWRESVNQTVGADRIADISSYVKRENQNHKSPIDNFYKETQDVMAAATPSSLNSNMWIGSLYVIAIVSSTENYFREILGRILKICPDSQKKAANNSINYGSVIWHPKDEVERGAFENISLASSENIISTAKRYVGIDLNKKGLKAILDEFDKICELRHGIVHSGRVLAGKNGLKLKLSPSEKITKIDIQYAQLQEISSVCTTLVVSFNKILFEEISKRWATTWRQSSSWSSDNEDQYFKYIWNAFSSNIDKSNGTIPLTCTWVKCRNLIKNEYNI